MLLQDSIPLTDSSVSVLQECFPISRLIYYQYTCKEMLFYENVNLDQMNHFEMFYEYLILSSLGNILKYLTS